MLELHFLRPAWLLALPFVLLLTILLWRRTGAAAWRRACDPHLLVHLLRREHRGFDWAPWLLGTAFILAVVALAGPSREAHQPMVRTLYGRVVVLDLSRSMDATDVVPTRLALARHKVIGLLERSVDLQTGLVVFAGDAFAVAPLTDDHRTLASILPVLDTTVMPSQGSRVDLGLQRAKQLLQSSGVNDGEVIVVSDGLKGTHAINVAADLLAAGFRVSVLAVGTPAGGVIQLRDGGVLRGLDGRVVMPAVSLQALRRLTRAGGGRLVRPSADGADLDSLTADTESRRRYAAVRETERTSPRWLDHGPWLVLGLLPLGALAFRRGWLLALALTFAPLATITTVSPVHAQSSGDDDGGRCPVESRRGGGTVEQAIAHYRNGRYVAAADLFACGDDAEAHYNRGTALARAWRLQQALAAFDQSLAHDPAHSDALHNRAIVAELLQYRGSIDEPEDESAPSGQRSVGSDVSTTGDASPAAPDTHADERRQSAADTWSGPDGAAGLPDAGAVQGEIDARIIDPRPGPGAAKLSETQKRALESALTLVEDDPAALWRQKLAYKYWRRERMPPRRSDAW